MVNFEAFRENLFSTIAMLGGNPGGRMSRFPSGSVAAMTGLPYAGENYALFNSRANVCEVAETLDFFGCRGIPFVAPVLPEARERISPVLDSNGLGIKNHYTAMMLAASDKFLPDPYVFEADEESLEKWADTAWYGFGGEAKTPDAYYDFTRYLMGRCENRLFLLEEQGKSVCCGLLHNSRMACGLYYFATLPEFRRMGFARRLMNSLACAAFETHSLFVLLATEEGLPFYRSFGFEEMAEIPIRSLEREV